MIIVLKLNPTAEDISTVEERVREMGYEPHKIVGEVRTVVACIGDETTHNDLHALITLPMVENVMGVQKKYKLISRDAQPDPVRVNICGMDIGGCNFHVIAGPCAVESSEQTISTAECVKQAGASMFRGGAFKPRTSPHDFQGMGLAGLDILAAAKAKTGLPIVTELVSEMDLEAVIATTDVIQIGTRNALNYSLLTAAAQTGKPILLKRGLASTINEWLLAAEYVAKQGNRNVILCERGIRTYETATRNTLDLSAVAVAKQETSLPVFVDPSHAAGRLDLLTKLSHAAIAVGADGLIVEVHPDPEAAMSDNAQQMPFPFFEEYMQSLMPYINVAGRNLVRH